MSQTVGESLRKSEKVSALVEELVQEVTSQNQKIEGVRPGLNDKKVEYDQIVENVGLYRGRPLFFPYVGSGSGRGPYVELADGSVKLDLINGIGIHLFGHSNPMVIEASVRGALADILMQGNLEPNLEYMELSRRLVDLAGRNSRMKYAWFSPSGSMANETALKMSRQKHSPARMIVTFENAFAGRTTMMAEITDNPNFKVGLPTYDEVLRIPFYNAQDPKSSEQALSKLKEHVGNHSGNISAFVFEPMQGEGGYKAAPREFFVPLLEFCKQNNIAVWADEVQTFTRTGEMFAYETLGIGEYIDMCTIGKTLQLAATLYTEEYNPKPGLVAGTFSASSPSLGASIAILDELSNGNYFGPKGSVQKIHEEFVAMLEDLNQTTCKGLFQDAGGLGLMVGVTPLDGQRDTVVPFVKTCFDNGLMAFGCGKNPFRIRFLLPIIMSSEDIQVARKILEKSVQAHS